MAPPFWVHCNMCNALLSKDNKHFILSCSHIMCKDCLKPTAGKKCPLCKINIRFEEMSKLPEKLKNNFQPDIENLLQEPSKIIKFQETQALEMTKKTRDYRTKYRQAKQIYEKEKKEVMKLKQQLDGYIHQRRLMQEKLKDVYTKNKMKKQQEIYRNPVNSTLSSGLSSGKMRSSSKSPSTSAAQSDFFDQNSPLGQDDISSRSNDFFGTRSSSSASKSSRNPAFKKIEHTQSDRTPFFA